MGFFVFGINHKECPIEVREKLHFTSSRLREALDLTRANAEILEAVLLSTCNRVEYYGYSDSKRVEPGHFQELIRKTHGLPAELYRDYVYHYEDKTAIRHLFRVAAGLDSLVIGENEILGQLREAFREANAAQTVHSLLYRLTEKALQVGKQVRTETKINQGAVSIPSVGVELAQKIFGHLNGEKVMVIGTGEMSLQTLRNLKDYGAQIRYLVSRNETRGREMAAQFEAGWLPLESWEPALQNIDILITSTASPYPIIKSRSIREVMTRRRNRPLFMIDLAVPRDVEAAINEIDDVYLYNIDDLKGIASANLRMRRREIEAAEAMVEKSVLEYQGWLERLKARPTMERFETFLDEILEKELGRLQDRPGLTEEEKTQIRQRIRAKLMHPPLEKIKEASKNGGVVRYLEALHSLFDLDE